MEKKKVLSLLIALFTVGISSAQTVGPYFDPLKGAGVARIAVESDGNSYDKDDWGATAFSMGLIWAFGMQNRFVFYNYSNNFALTNATAEKEMDTSAIGGAHRFHLDPTVVISCRKNTEGAIANWVREGNKSTKENPLIVIEAGPMEMAYRGLMAMDPTKRQFVYLISHSGWNDNFSGTNSTHKWSDLQAIRPAANFIHISDQNAKLGTGTNWSALNAATDTTLKWLYSRQTKIDGDVSDAGMMWFLFTGNQNGTNTDVVNKLKNPVAPLPAIGVTGISPLNSERSNKWLRAKNIGSSFQIQIPESGANSNLILTDLMGQERKINSTNSQSGWTTIEKSGLTAGVYFVSLQEKPGSSQFMGKVILNP